MTALGASRARDSMSDEGQCAGGGTKGGEGGHGMPCRSKVAKGGAGARKHDERGDMDTQRPRAGCQGEDGVRGSRAARSWPRALLVGRRIMLALLLILLAAAALATAAGGDCVGRGMQPWGAARPVRELPCPPPPSKPSVFCGCIHCSVFMEGRFASLIVCGRGGKRLTTSRSVARSGATTCRRRACLLTPHRLPPHIHRCCCATEGVAEGEGAGEGVGDGGGRGPIPRTSLPLLRCLIRTTCPTARL